MSRYLFISDNNERIMLTKEMWEEAERLAFEWGEAQEDDADLEAREVVKGNEAYDWFLTIID